MYWKVIKSGKSTCKNHQHSTPTLTSVLTIYNDFSIQQHSTPTFSIPYTSLHTRLFQQIETRHVALCRQLQHVETIQHLFPPHHLSTKLNTPLHYYHMLKVEFNTLIAHGLRTLVSKTLYIYILS